jgi:hypothetical protein
MPERVVSELSFRPTLLFLSAEVMAAALSNVLAQKNAALVKLNSPDDRGMRAPEWTDSAQYDFEAKIASPDVVEALVVDPINHRKMPSEN